MHKGLARQLKRLRAEHGLTQVQLAKRAGLAALYLSRLEAGRYHDPSLSVLQKLARALKTTVGGLLGERRTADGRRRND